MEKKSPRKNRRSLQDVKSPESTKFERIIDSPGRSPSQGNLTGTPRKVKDAAADWHNSIRKWELYVQEGSRIIDKITNIKLEKISGNSEENAVHSKSSEMPTQLGPLCDNLVVVYENLLKVLKKMETLTSVLKGVSVLEKHQLGDSMEPMFLTWPAAKFHEASQTLSDMYREEIKLKQAALENVAHANDRDLMMFYMASWVHEPYIEQRAKTLLEAMLLESGHR